MAQGDLAAANDALSISRYGSYQSAFTVSIEAADGTVEVTVDARGQLVKSVIDEAY